MTDIVERLRTPNYWFSGSSEGHEGENDAPFEAADEIMKLREEITSVEQWYLQAETQWTERLEEKDKIIVAMREALERIRMKTSANPMRTFDVAIDDCAWAADETNRALALTPDDNANE